MYLNSLAQDADGVNTCSIQRITFSPQESKRRQQFSFFEPLVDLHWVAPNRLPQHHKTHHPSGLSSWRSAAAPGIKAASRVCVRNVGSSSSASVIVHVACSKNWLVVIMLRLKKEHLKFGKQSRMSRWVVSFSKPEASVHEPLCFFEKAIVISWSSPDKCIIGHGFTLLF